MAIPNFEAIMLPALRIIGNADKVAIALQTITLKVCDEFVLSEKDRQITYSNGRSIMSNRVRFAVGLFLYKAGLVVRPQRGYYKISDSGRQLLQNPPKEITRQYINRYLSYRKSQKRKSTKKQNR